MDTPTPIRNRPRRSGVPMEPSQRANPGGTVAVEPYHASTIPLCSTFVTGDNVVVDVVDVVVVVVVVEVVVVVVVVVGAVKSSNQRTVSVIFSTARSWLFIW